MKTDDEIASAIAAGHDRELRYVEWLRSKGLEAELRSQGFRRSLDDIREYARDVDFVVEGYSCQLKVRSRRLAEIILHGWHPLVDERTKADRNPVDYYILHHPDRVLVCNYRPNLWGVTTRYDPSDRSTKDYYTVNPAYGLSLGEWVERLRGQAAFELL